LLQFTLYDVTIALAVADGAFPATEAASVAERPWFKTPTHAHLTLNASYVTRTRLV